MAELDRLETIRDYIIKHGGCTKTEVINYMYNNKISSLATTHKIILKMINDGAILVEPDKKNRQIHHLHINDNYSKIDREINKIKEIMDSMDYPIKIMNRDDKRKKHSTDEELQESLENYEEPLDNIKDFYVHFIFPYEESISMMIRILFVRISEIILSEKDAHSLRTKLMNLSNKLATQIFNVNKQKNYLDFCKSELDTFQLPTTTKYLSQNGVDLSLRKDIIKYISEFEEKFLS